MITLNADEINKMFVVQSSENIKFVDHNLLFERNNKFFRDLISFLENNHNKMSFASIAYIILGRIWMIQINCKKNLYDILDLVHSWQNIITEILINYINKFPTSEETESLKKYINEINKDYGYICEKLKKRENPFLDRNDAHFTNNTMLTKSLFNNIIYSDTGFCDLNYFTLDPLKRKTFGLYLYGGCDLFVSFSNCLFLSKNTEFKDNTIAFFNNMIGSVFTTNNMTNFIKSNAWEEGRNYLQTEQPLHLTNNHYNVPIKAIVISTISDLEVDSRPSPQTLEHNIETIYNKFQNEMKLQLIIINTSTAIAASRKFDYSLDAIHKEYLLKEYNYTLYNLSKKLGFLLIDVDMLCKKHGIGDMKHHAHYSSIIIDEIALQLHEILVKLYENSK